MNGIDLSLPDASQVFLDKSAQDVQEMELRGATDEEAADRFQTLLTTMLVKEMRRGLPEGFFGSAPGADTYDSWLDDHLGKSLASQDALGLAGMLKTSVRRLEQRANGGPETPTPPTSALPETDR